MVQGPRLHVNGNRILFSPGPEIGPAFGAERRASFDSIGARSDTHFGRGGANKGHEFGFDGSEACEDGARVLVAVCAVAGVAEEWGG